MLHYYIKELSVIETMMQHNKMQQMTIDRLFKQDKKATDADKVQTAFDKTK